MQQDHNTTWLWADDWLIEKKQEYRMMEKKWRSWLSRCPKKDKVIRQRIWEDIEQEKADFKRKILSELRERHLQENIAVQLYEQHFQDTEKAAVSPTKSTKNRSFYKRSKEKNAKLEYPVSESPKVVVSPGEEEWKRVEDMLQSKGLKIYNVAGDGDCLFRAFGHQLESITGEKYSTSQLRQLVALTMRKERDRYLPFLTDEEGVAYHKDFERYCLDLEEHRLWGGELELKVLSEIFQIPVEVFMDGVAAPLEIFPDQMHKSCADNNVRIRLSFHRYLYSLGSHYNSVLPI